MKIIITVSLLVLSLQTYGKNETPKEPFAPTVQPKNLNTTNTVNIEKSIEKPRAVLQLGNTKGGYKDGPLEIALFNRPLNIAVDKQGNAYFVDSNMIRKISVDGQVSTIAGDRRPGYLDGNGTNARFCRPTGITLDSGNNIYVADTENHKVRKVTQDGVVTTIAGDAEIFRDYTADRKGACRGHQYPVSKDRKYASQTPSRQPRSIVVDSKGNIYVSDPTNRSVFKITPDEKVSLFISGSSYRGYVDGPGHLAKFSLPNGIVVDTKNNLYVADSRKQRIIRKITKEGVVSTFAGSDKGFADGKASVAQFSHLVQMAIDSSDNLLIPDTKGSIRKVTPDGMVSTIISQVLEADVRTFPYGHIAVDQESNIYTARKKIRRISTDGKVTVLSGAKGKCSDGMGENSGISYIGGIASDSKGNIYATGCSYLIKKITSDGNVKTYAGSKRGHVDGHVKDALFSSPRGITIDKDDNIYVVDNNLVRKITADGMVSTLAGHKKKGYRDGYGADARFDGIYGITVDLKGNVYVTERANSKVRKITKDGNVSTVAGGTLGKDEAKFSAWELGIDQSDNLYIASRYNHRILKVTPDGVISRFAGSGSVGYSDGGLNSAKFNEPYAIAFDKYGNAYVSDKLNKKIRKIKPDGYVTTLTFKDNGWVGRPEGIAVDDFGNIYVTDTHNHLIHKIEAEEK